MHIKNEYKIEIISAALRRLADDGRTKSSVELKEVIDKYNVR